MGLIGSGKGNSAQQTNQSATNQQVATTSGVAVGANSQASINIQTSDPETVKAALLANAGVNRDSLVTNAHVTDSALDFAGHAAEVAASTNRQALTSIENIAGGSILANSNLATKFIDNSSKDYNSGINLLQSIGNQQSDIALASQQLASRALDSSFAVSRAVAPQDTNFTVTTTIKYIAIGLAVVFGAFFIFRKKS